MSSAPEEQLYLRISALERANLLWKSATLLLALAVLALLVLGGSVGMALVLHGVDEREHVAVIEREARANADMARVQAEVARQNEARARQRAEEALREAEAARQRAEEALRATGLPAADAKKTP